MKKLIKNFAALAIFTVSLVFPAKSQDTAYARQMITELCSEKYAGRGYSKNGQLKAAKFIAAEMKKIGLQPFGKSHLQPMNYPGNSFTKGVFLKRNDEELKCAEDFLPDPAAKASKGKGTVIKVNDALALTQLMKDNPRSPLLIEDRLGPFLSNVRDEEWKAFRGVIIVQKDEKLIYGASIADSDKAILNSRKGLLKHGDVLEWDVKSDGVNMVKMGNIIGFVPAETPTAKSIIIGAHYDHLGMIGKVMFPGANDNAGGVAMMMDMAREVVKNPGKVNWYFMAFCAEEMGLIGSINFGLSRTPSFKDSILFMMNLDLVATGKEGITAINGSVLKKEFSLLTEINQEMNLVPQVLARDNAPNSDHWVFTRLGIPAFFVYQMDSSYPYYHQPGDRAEIVPLTGYNGTYKLLLEFLRQMGELSE